MRPAEIHGIALYYSVIDETNDKADLRLQPKAKSGLHKYKIHKTANEIVCPRRTLYDWITRLQRKFGKRQLFSAKRSSLWWDETISIKIF
jgi:hypothetical protein